MHKTYSTSDDTNRQLSLFDYIPPNDSRPLPLLVAEKWGFPLQYYEPNEEQQEYLYAIQDWLRGLSAYQKKADQFLKDFKRLHPETVELLHPLKYRTTNNKLYERLFADEKTLYDITQRFQARTEVHTEILDYLARAGVALDAARRDPQKAAELVGALSRHHKIRLEGIVERNELTAWISQNIKQAFNYGLFTNIEYKGLFGRDAKALREQTGVRNPREAMTTEGLAFVSAAEAACHRLLNNRQVVTSVEAYQIMGQVAQAIGVNVQALQDLVGVDLATGRPLLKAPDPL